MNLKNIAIVAAFVTLAVALGVHLAASEAVVLTKMLGKAAWFLPYAAVVGAIRFANFRG